MFNIFVKNVFFIVIICSNYYCLVTIFFQKTGIIHKKIKGNIPMFPFTCNNYQHLKRCQFFFMSTKLKANLRPKNRIIPNYAYSVYKTFCFYSASIKLFLNFPIWCFLWKISSFSTCLLPIKMMNFEIVFLNIVCITI